MKTLLPYLIALAFTSCAGYDHFNPFVVTEYVQKPEWGMAHGEKHFVIELAPTQNGLTIDSIVIGQLIFQPEQKVIAANDTTFMQFYPEQAMGINPMFQPASENERKVAIIWYHDSLADYFQFVRSRDYQLIKHEKGRFPEE